MMSKHILYICKSCNTQSNEEKNHKQSEGLCLFNQLQLLHQNWSKNSELEIQSVDCLWACGHPCVVAFSGADKFTYLLMDLPLSESAVALLQLSELYLDSNDGVIPWNKFPKVLKSDTVARIPSFSISKPNL
ncbi:DUF1636 domain-containing protein [Chlorogloeopsis sp. ULAP01]|uniref:DUF1636 domain-containing protein n=1 Tax=Chlorogloeopsis sp. ULAP01 TaxID=3056483 RepID=UPI0025AA5E54|nr:DUF1636 domain-containing protein [Chlorogloeopsis sp. ULAP01]MDM9384248.1 DUF1636 domain-containing protein [Chlorogloeopsis sp. ULAP01]